MSARVVVADVNGNVHTLMMFNSVIKRVVGDGVIDFK